LRTPSSIAQNSYHHHHHYKRRKQCRPNNNSDSEGSCRRTLLLKHPGYHIPTQGFPNEFVSKVASTEECKLENPRYKTVLRRGRRNVDRHGLGGGLVGLNKRYRHIGS